MSHSASPRATMRRDGGALGSLTQLDARAAFTRDAISTGARSDSGRSRRTRPQKISRPIAPADAASPTRRDPAKSVAKLVADSAPARIVVRSVSRKLVSAPQAQPQPERPAWDVVAGRAGDHPDVYRWLIGVFQGPSREEFQASQEDPGYEPTQRILIKRDGDVVSHAQLTSRIMRFGSLALPIDRLSSLGTLPEYRNQGAASQLLHAADIKMRSGGALLGMLRTKIPHFFHRHGWAVCGRHCVSQAKARDILARHGTREVNPQLNLRQWRHVELPALMRIYAQNTAHAFGPIQRTEAYWRWLLCRKAFDYIVVAIAGPDKLELNEETAPIVGYAVVRQQRVVELLTDPAYPHAGPQLLARACADGIERNRNEVYLEAPPHDPLHASVQSAGGVFRHRESDDQEVFMVKLLDGSAMLETLLPTIAQRAAASGILTCDLGIVVGADKYRLTIGRRGIKLSAGRLGRSYIACNKAELTRLLLGHDEPQQAARQNRLVASTQVALETAGALFPRVPLWRPLWDDCTA